jgi:hypothetical protein
MINENGFEINKIEYVFLRTKSCILGKEVLNFPYILFQRECKES